MKKVLFGLCVAFATASVQASYLMWQVDSNEDTSLSAVQDYATALGLDYTMLAARVVAVDGSGTKTYLKDASGVETAGFVDELVSQRTNVDLSELTGSLNSYSYYVEIVKAADHSFIVGENALRSSYSDISTSIAQTLEDIPTVTSTWHGGGAGGYKATPEPTSAMLMLLGVAGLALKRKQKKA